jgi:hypothetical protein
MARVEIYYRCPACNTLYDSTHAAVKCRNSHAISQETWAVGRNGKSVRFFDHLHPDSMYGRNWALREAELSDYIEERKKQLAELQERRH